MFQKALLLVAGAAAVVASPADARYRHHHYRHYRYYSSYYSPYSYYSYPAYSYSYPAYYGYPAYYSFPSYYAYPAYSYPTVGLSIGIGGGYHRRWR